MSQDEKKIPGESENPYDGLNTLFEKFKKPKLQINRFVQKKQKVNGQRR